MQIIMDLPDQVVTEFYKRVPVQERTSYLSGLLMKDFGLVKHTNVTTADEDFGSLYAVLKDVPKASYTEDSLSIQQSMRNEWS